MGTQITYFCLFRGPRYSSCGKKDKIFFQLVMPFQNSFPVLLSWAILAFSAELADRRSYFLFFCLFSHFGTIILNTISWSITVHFMVVLIRCKLCASSAIDQFHFILFYFLYHIDLHQMPSFRVNLISWDNESKFCYWIRQNVCFSCLKHLHNSLAVYHLFKFIIISFFYFFFFKLALNNILCSIGYFCCCYYPLPSSQVGESFNEMYYYQLAYILKSLCNDVLFRE